MTEGLRKRSLAWEFTKGLAKVSAYIVLGVVFCIVGGAVGFLTGYAIEQVTWPLTRGLLTIVTTIAGAVQGVRLAIYVVNAFAESKDVLPGI